MPFEIITHKSVNAVTQDISRFWDFRTYPCNLVPVDETHACIHCDDDDDCDHDEDDDCNNVDDDNDNGNDNGNDDDNDVSSEPKVD